MTDQQTHSALGAPYSAFNRRALASALAVLTGMGLLTLLIYYLPSSGALYANDALSPERIIAYALLLMGLLLVFVPVSAALRLGPVWLLATGAWVMLVYVLLFVPPGSRSDTGFFTYVAFLAILFVALSSLLAMPMAALGRAFLPPPTNDTAGMARALRQGALLSLAAVSLLVMSPLGVLNWLNTLLIFTIAALTEFFFIVRD